MKSNSSRLGVRGSEALGGGLSRHFPDRIGGRRGHRRRLGSTLGTRETFVGLQGGWGTFKMGYFLTPYDDIHPIFGNVPTLATSILGTQALWSNTGWAGNYQYGGAFDDRAANSIRYDSPNIARLHGQRAGRRRDRGWRSDQRTAGITSGIVASGTPSGTTLAAATSPCVHAVVERPVQQRPVPGRYRVRSSTTTSVRQPLHAGQPDTNQWPIRLQDEAFSIAASWNFGVAKIGGVFERLKYDIATGGDLKRNFWGASRDLEPRTGTVVRDVRLGAGRPKARRSTTRRSAPSARATTPARNSGKSATRTRCRSAR